MREARWQCTSRRRQPDVGWHPGDWRTAAGRPPSAARPRRKTATARAGGSSASQPAVTASAYAAGRGRSPTPRSAARTSASRAPGDCFRRIAVFWRPRRPSPCCRARRPHAGRGADRGRAGGDPRRRRLVGRRPGRRTRQSPRWRTGAPGIAAKWLRTRPGGRLLDRRAARVPLRPRWRHGRRSEVCGPPRSAGAGRLVHRR